MSREPYHDEELLRALHWGQGWSMRKIAEKFDLNHTTIRDWMERHDIPRRDRVEATSDARRVDGGDWYDEEALRRLYVEEEMSATEIAEELECSPTTVLYWMKRFSIPRRDRSEIARVEWVTHRMDRNGEGWADWISGEFLQVHQLLAIADGADPHEVFDEDTACHHKSGHPLDNRPGNIEVMEHGEHTSYHRQQETPECKHRVLQSARVMDEGRA